MIAAKLSETEEVRFYGANMRVPAYVMTFPGNPNKLAYRDATADEIRIANAILLAPPPEPIAKPIATPCDCSQTGVTYLGNGLTGPCPCGINDHQAA